MQHRRRRPADEIGHGRVVDLEHAQPADIARMVETDQIAGAEQGKDAIRVRHRRRCGDAGLRIAIRRPGRPKLIAPRAWSRYRQRSKERAIEFDSGPSRR